MANDSFSFEDAQREAAAASDGPWKNYAASAPSRDGPWNQYAGQKSGSFSFEEAQGSPENQGGTISDLGKSLKVGVQRLPGVATGLADLPVALATGARPFTKMADYVGEKTGFQPGKWADETKFSQGYEQSKQAVDQAWDQGGVGNIAKAYLTNPGYTANQVVESLPSMVAGGLAGRALMGAGAVAGRAATATQAAREAVPGALERAVGEKAATAISAGAGEGVVTAGQQMQQVTDGDQQKNALAALGAGAATGAIGGVAGRAARAMGLETAETALVNAGRRGAVHAADEVPLSAKRRILGGMVSEAVLQELPQSAQEQMWQNWAEGKPLMDGVARQAVEGSLAGAAMGAGANVSDGGAGKRRVETEKALQRTLDAIRSAEELARKNDPNTAPDWTTSAGAADLNAEPATGTASVANAPGVVDAGFTTSPGAAPAREAGVDFTRDVDTSGLSLQDPAEVERERASRIDYVPGDTTPQWATTAGAAPESQPGLDMPPPTFDTGDLSLDMRTPSQRMGIDPAAGPLSKAATMAVDSGAHAQMLGQQAQQAQFLGATGRDIAPRRTGPGLNDDSNVIDVQGRVIDEPAIGTPRRLTTQESAQESGAQAFLDGVPRAEIAAIPNVVHRASQLRGYDEAARQASTPALPAPRNVRNGLERIRAQRQLAAQAAQSPHANPTGAVPHGPQTDQAQQGGTQQPQARNQEAAGRAAAPAGAAAPNGGSGVQADGLNRPQNWRTSMLRAGPVARAMGLQTKGKRLAQVVAEIDAADARRAGVPQDGTDLSAGRLNRTWSVFAPETGSLGVPRDQMPQIKAEHRGALVNFLKARGIDSRAEEVPANDLKPTQAEFSPAKVEKARAFKGGDRSILVSSDGYVVDGHHQWLAKRANGEPVKVIRLKAPIQQVLQQVAQFPSTTAAGANLGASHAIARNLRLADERAPGAGAAAPHGTGESVAGAAPAVGAGQRQGGGTDKPGAVVRAAVPDAGGASEPTSSVGQVVLQNRDRSSSASITQMNAIAANPDYLRTGPSRTMDQGAPVVFGDLPQGALLGRAETVADGSGNRVKVRYAVVDAGSVLPSNAADGTPSMGYAAGMPGKLRAVAGNARAAGLIEAFNRGTAKTYQQELTDDAQTLGIDPQPLAQMQRPMLVRLMDEADITPDMGDRTNIQAGAAMSAVEQAANDVRRVDVASLQFDDAGNPTRETLAAFINQMPVSERGAMLNSDGTPTKQAIDRLVAAAFKQAYGNDALVELAAQATDPEARTVISALASVAGDMAQLAGTGEFDIRQAVSEAAQKAVNARRRGLPLQKVLQERDLQDTPEMLVVAQFMADNIRSAKRMADGLRAWASLAQAQVQTARENERSAGLFGETPVLGRERIFERLGRDGQTESAQRGGPRSAAQDTGRQDAPERERKAGGAQDGRAGSQERATQAATEVESNDGRFGDALVARENEASYETDLFGDPVPASARRAVRAQSMRTGLRGNVQPAAEIRDTQTPEGQYFVRTIVGHETQRRLGADLIRTPQDAAQATSYLYKSAVERFDAIVTDKDGKPLAVVGGFKGAISQTAVYPATVVAEAVRVPGAARVWFSHNHPSGNSMLSRADENLMHVLSDAFRGSGIEPQGLMAVSNGKFSFLNANGVAVDAAVIPSAESAASTTVPVIERELAENGATMPVGDPGTALRVAKDFHKQGGDGILLLNAQNVVAAWVPITDQMRGALRHTGALNAIYRAISESNAAAAILVHDGNLDADHPESRAVTVGNNIAAALAKVDVRPLDSINVKTGKSLAQTGLPVAAGPMFSRSINTKEAYEARIDALFAGEKATSGTRVLDRSDVMGLLGHPDVPLMLNERHLLDGLTNHPEMTAAAWKKVPEWLENPAMVYRDPRESGRLVVIAPETLAGYPVMLVVEPAPTPAARGSAEPFQLLVTAYAKTSGNFPVPGYLASSGNLLYVDTKNAPAVLQRAGVQFPGQAVFQQGRHKILSEKNLAGYRRANNPAYSQPLRPELANQLLQLQPKPATKESVQAAVRQLVGIGMLPNRLGRVVVATSSEIKQDWEPIIGKTGMEASGEAGQAQGFYDPKTKTVFLIADHINAGDELGVVAHELMHKHGQAVLGEEGWNTLHSVISGWAKAEAGSMERRVYAEAAARVRQSRPSDADVGEYSSQELFPYAVQVALELGVKPNAFSRPGTVAKWLAQVKLALREVWKKVTGTARGEATFKSQDLVNLAFGIAQRENPAHAGELDGALRFDGDGQKALAEFAKNDELFALPKSTKDTIEGIAKDNDPTISVRVTRFPGNETMYTLTIPGGDGTARITVRKSGKDSVYGARDAGEKGHEWEVGRPGENPQDVPVGTEDVWIDVSALKPGQNGSMVYNIAATFAHNTGRIFIGDPSGVSAVAMRRRLENMLSSALKFGTTRHIAPHPDQVRGRDGVPPLKWVYGDDVGNVNRMMQASVKALDNAFPESKLVAYDPERGFFNSKTGTTLSRGELASLGRKSIAERLAVHDGAGRPGQAGWRTVARAALYRYLGSHSATAGDGAGTGMARGSPQLSGLHSDGSTGALGSAEERKSRIFYSRSVAATSDDYSQAQARAAERVFGVQKKQTLAERAQAMRANLGTKLRQGLVDQFAPIKEVSEKAYILARLSKGSDGAVEAAMLYGKPYLRDGVADVDIKDGGFAKVLASLKGEEVRFFQWVAAHRAERLKAEGKENLLTQQDISDLKTLNAGRMADGTPRLGVYAQALRELNAFNEAALRVAMESGLMDQAAYDLMKDQPYVPFYRLMEDGDMRGPRFSSGLVNQQAWKKLKGGTQQLNADLLQNTLLNWSHLYAAAARNRASLETMAAAEKMGIAYRVSAETKGAVKVMRDGMAEHWAVEDPYLLDAISAMSYAPGGLVKAMAPFKRLLTFGVTVNPAFKIRNLIRDSLSAIAQADLSYNPLANVAGAWKASGSESQTYASMLASGGIIKFGTQENANRVRAQIERLGGEVLDQTGFGKLKGQMRSLWEAYEEFGDRTENVNRVALYERLIAKGHSHAEASFMARDLMDFSMSGKWEVVRFLTQTVPFLNARLQGLYKLGRAAKEDPRRFAAMTGAVAMASMALMMAYSDDDDWKKREDWDRDTYWWFKIGDKAFRIPKPFEVGAIGTLAERTAELMFSKEMTGKRFGQRISDMVFNTFAMDPTPQFIKPFLDVYANKDSFSQRPIEGMADERLRPQDRFNERTSEVARLLGSWGLPDPVRLAKGEYSGLSPKQIDFLLRGYFGWLATVTTAATDAVVRPVLGRGERPAMRLRDAFLAGNFVENLPAGSSRYVTAMYEQARDVEQAWASYQAALKSGDTEQAQSIRESDGSKLRSRMALVHAKRQIAELGQQAKRIESNRLMPAEEKRRRLDEIEERKHRVAQRVAVTS